MEATTLAQSTAAPVAWRPAARYARRAGQPFSRWYIAPLADALAERLAARRVAPSHVTLAGVLAAALGAAILFYWPTSTLFAAGLVLVAWLCDRTDGALARRLNQATQAGAWLDANCDELTDLGLHAAVASAAAQQGSTSAWAALACFFAGKYLFMYSLQTEEVHAPAATSLGSGAANPSLARWLYHAPANADVRVHLLLAGLVTGWLTVELWFVAVYYGLRWLLRWRLVPARLGGRP